jgi:hypothetical protein
MIGNGFFMGLGQMRFHYRTRHPVAAQTTVLIVKGNAVVTFAGVASA